MDELLRQLSDIQSAAQVSADYTKTLALLRALKSGIVSLDNVTMTADGWSVAAVIPQPKNEEASA